MRSQKGSSTSSEPVCQWAGARARRVLDWPICVAEMVWVHGCSDGGFFLLLCIAFLRRLPGAWWTDGGSSLADLRVSPLKVSGSGGCLGIGKSSGSLRGRGGGESRKSRKDGSCRHGECYKTRVGDGLALTGWEPSEITSPSSDFLFILRGQGFSGFRLSPKWRQRTGRAAISKRMVCETAKAAHNGVFHGILIVLLPRRRGGGAQQTSKSSYHKHRIGRPPFRASPLSPCQ